MANSKEIQKLVDERVKYCKSNYESRYLDLSNLGITEIPNEVFLLKDLAILFLSNNNISELPKDFFILENLQKLYLENNELTEFPKEIIGFERLEYLYLENNFITSIPNWVLNFKRLSILNLMGNPIQIPNNFNDDLGYSYTAICHWLREYYQKEKPKQNILKIPTQLKTSIKQYLNFFPDFVLHSKGVKINFEVTSVEEGLSLEIEEKEEETINQINTYLQEYMDLLQIKNEEIEILFSTNATDFEKELLITQQQVQINNLKNALAIKKLENSYLTEVLKQPILLSTSLIETLHNATLDAQNGLRENNLPIPYLKDGYLWQQMPDGKHIQLEKLEPLKTA